MDVIMQKTVVFNTRNWKTSTTDVGIAVPRLTSEQSARTMVILDLRPRMGGVRLVGWAKQRMANVVKGSQRKETKATSKVASRMPHQTMFKKEEEKEMEQPMVETTKEKVVKKNRLQQWQKNKFLGQQKEILQLNNNRRLERHRIPQLLWKRS